jgi:hypothetical protein
MFDLPLSSRAGGTFSTGSASYLVWGSSNNTTSYEYCNDTTDDNACINWINNSTNTRITLNHLTENTLTFGMLEQSIVFVPPIPMEQYEILEFHHR